MVYYFRVVYFRVVFQLKGVDTSKRGERKENEFVFSSLAVGRGFENEILVNSSE